MPEQSEDRPTGPTKQDRADSARWFAEREARKVTTVALDAWLTSPAAQAEDAVNRADKVRAHDSTCDTLEWLWLPGRAEADQGEPGACADCGLVFQDGELVVLGSEKYDPVLVWRCTCCLLAYRRARRA
ncbi:MAG TPA: hypothetical protein VGX23_33700 [Actinocrinis sp.]|nr:hypothetical protein [Actinocrinis sp.]